MRRKFYGIQKGSADAPPKRTKRDPRVPQDEKVLTRFSQVGAPPYRVRLSVHKQTSKTIIMDTIKRGGLGHRKSVWATGAYTFSLLIGIIDLMSQNGSNIDLIDDIYFAFFARDFRQAADYYTVN